MAYPHSHKTVIVLDRGLFFEKSSQQPIDFDVFAKGRGNGLVPMPPICKSMGTCNIEACMEFCRIVFDLHPSDRCIRMISSTYSKSKVLNSWERKEQNTQLLMAALADHDDEEVQQDNGNTLIHGLSSAVEVLCQPTNLQLSTISNSEETGDNLLNNGRIICLTHLKSESEVRALEECVQDSIVEHNKLASENPSLLTIDHCELVLIHIVPVGQGTMVATKAKHHVSSLLSSEVDITQSGQFIAHKMVELCTTHYKLCSTTVTGIPMKEEQNASSSANYDVELLHPSDVHDDLFKSGCAEGLIIPSKEGLNLKTVTLKWCTPKSNNVELHQCTGVHRFTPVDVNSRPSSCLTNFLLNGRSVMLEQPRKTGNRVMSHMLTSHGGELYIHVLSTARSTLEDPPSISEGCGGRITDYRINDFGEMMKDCRLAPFVDISSYRYKELPVERAKAQLERLTRLWPLTISDTIIFNMLSHLDPLPALITKEELDEDDVLECKKSIYHVVGMESRNEPLPIPQSGNRGKGPKREEQYRQMWSELEKLIRAHSESSPMHKKILECLLECKKPDELKPVEVKQESVKEEKPAPTSIDLAWKEYDGFSKMTDREKQEWNKTDIKSPDSPPVKKMKTESIFAKGSGPQSVLSLWTSRINALQNSRCNEFVGRLESGNKAELYKHLKEEAKTNTEATSSIKTEKGKK